jgi:uncharacterized protein (DUF885 family)
LAQNWLAQKMWISVLIVGFLFGIPALPRTAHGGDAEALEQLFADYWRYALEEDPLYATQVGEHRYNHRLPSVSVADQQRRLAREQEFRARLETIDRDALREDDHVNYDVFARLRNDRIAELEHRSYLMPITSRTGFHVSFPELWERVPLSTVRDYENYIARLQGFHDYAREHIELMREGIREGYVLPAVVLEGYESAIEPHIVDDPEQSLLHRAFLQFPDGVPDAARERLTAAGGEAILGSVVPGYREFLRFMLEEYAPAASKEIGASALPNGRAYYEHRVRSFTTLDVTPEEVHQIGLQEVTRIRAEMEAIIEDLGFEGTFEEFLQFLRTDERFYVGSPRELMREVAYVLKRMDGELPRLFRTLPRMTYGIREIPDYIAPRTTTAYYTRPAGDGSRSGTYWVNTHELPSRPLYEVEALSLHEAVPGHHLQIALQQELEGLPDFRRFSGFTVFTEGWGLYAERLGLEVGFYTDPYSDFGRLTYEMWRACRLVVDTGMHYLGWSRQRAIDLMAGNTALTLHNVTTEVDRYISQPGQALAYKIGELEIRRLRQRAAEALNDAFDVRDFHDVVLGSGAVPLDVLETNVERWIAQFGVNHSDDDQLP